MRKFFVIILVVSAGIFLFSRIKQGTSVTGAIATTINLSEASSPLPMASNSAVTSEQEISSSTPTFSEPVEKIPVVEKPEVQIIKGIITWEEGLIPAEYTVKAGVPVRFEIDPKDDIEGCMSTILVEELYENYHFIQAGKKIVMEFTPNRAGEYYIVCAMGVEFGKITVEK